MTNIEFSFKIIIDTICFDFIIISSNEPFYLPAISTKTELSLGVKKKCSKVSKTVNTSDHVLS